MNWKLLIGQLITKTDNIIIKSGFNFIKKNYPYRRNWIFDLKRIHPNSQLILDVGAYVGDVSVEFSKWYPEAKIYAFEPVNESFIKLQKSIEGNSNIYPYNLAIGDKNATVTIPLYDSATTNTLKQAQYDTLPTSQQQVTVRRLDDFLLEHNLTGHIDILKIDVEGYELEALRGMGEFLKNVKYLVTEVGYQRSNTKTHFTDMEIFMEKNEFEIFNIYELMPVYNDRTKLSYSNNIYVNKRFKP